MKSWKGTEYQSASGSLTYEHLQSVFARQVYGRFINTFFFTYSKRYKKSYLYYESPTKRIKLIEYV